MKAIMLSLIRMMPRALSLLLLRALGLVFYYCMPERRRIAFINLDIAFGDALAKQEKERIAKVSFQNFAAFIFDFLKLAQMSPEERSRYIEIQGEQHLKEALSLGRGVLAVSAHFGNFPLLLTAMSLKGYPVKVVTRHFKSAWADRLYTGLLNRFGTGTFPRDKVAAHILKALKNKGIVGYVLDQNMQNENGIFVNFFGRQACTIKGLATLAGRYASPIVPAFIVSEPSGLHRIYIEKSYVPDDPKGLKEKEFELTQRYTALIEEWIRRYPEQWLWGHRRWKTRPEGEMPIYPAQGGLKRRLRRWRKATRKTAPREDSA
jgi:KDO2-lipid IV(A) lauroyltransferase